jgi:hypothetical protein
MTDNILPQLHSTGVYKLKQPYDSLLNNNILYTCIAIRELQELKLKGIDAFNLYYEPYGLNKEQYNDDYVNNVAIITLKNSAGEIKFVPSSYLMSFPNSSGYQYAVLSLGINLGALPIDRDLTFLKQKLSDLIKDEIGVDSEAKIMQVSQVEVISDENHKTYEAARKNIMENSTTDRAKVIKLTKENEEYRTKVTELEQAIIQLLEEKNNNQ